MSRGGARRARVAALAAALVAAPLSAAAQSALSAIELRPEAIVDLRSREGLSLMRGEWRYADARVQDAEFRAPGPDLKPNGPPIRTLDILPRAGRGDFDDAAWEVLDPTTLEARRGSGRTSFNWYRLRLTVPDKVGGLDPTGATLVFELVLDDYAEIWVDGRLPKILGQSGGALVRGYNAPNRIVLTRDARPGQTFRLAIFGANGPLSEPPANYIWIRSATLEVHDGRRLAATRRWVGEVERLDPALDSVIAPGTRLEKLAEGFQFTEGPLWMPDGHLLFSDPNANRIYRWSEDDGLHVFRVKSGYTGLDAGEYGQPGSNGLALDAEGRVTIAEHGNRRITRLERNGLLTVLADRYEGKRLNSPNDLIYRSDGTLYFTDPPFGLPRFHDDPRREQPHFGVYSLRDGRLRLESAELTGPNGVAFSPDERFLYVTNWDTKKKVVMRHEVRPDGSLTPGRVFFDMGSAPGDVALDGIKVDALGNLYVSGPGGLWVLSAAGRHIGMIRGPELAANFAWGDADRRTLYLTARTGLYRLRLRVAGATTEFPAADAVTPASAPAPWIERRHPRFDALVPAGAVVEKVVGGFTWVEGPLWDRAADALLFTHLPENAVYRWREGRGPELVLKSAGYTGMEPFRGAEPGANGLTFDGEGRLVLCQHGDRQVSRIEADGRRTLLAGRYRGRRLNSPNDLVHDRDGNLYFTDPPFGLPGAFTDPGRELSWSGLYRLSPAGELRLLTRALRAPNGLAVDASRRRLVVSNADRAHPVWMTYPIKPDGGLGPGRLLFDARDWVARYPGAPDGLKLDRDGNIFAAGPGGVHVFAPEGTHLGSIMTGVATSNCAWGDDGGTLYITASDSIWRIALTTRGHIPGPEIPLPAPTQAQARP